MASGWKTASVPLILWYDFGLTASLFFNQMARSAALNVTDAGALETASVSRVITTPSTTFVSVLARLFQDFTMLGTRRVNH